MGIVSKGLKDIEDICHSSQSGTWRKKIVYTKKAYEIECQIHMKYGDIDF